MPVRTTLVVTALACGVALEALAQAPRPLLPIEFQHSAEYRWLRKPVLARRLLDDMTDSSRWRLTGTGAIAFGRPTSLGAMRAARVELQMFRDAPAPTRNQLSSVNLRRAVGGEDWRSFNRLSFWIRADARGFPTVPIQLVLNNEGAERVPDRYGREGIHLVTLPPTGWQQVVWEIEQLPRDRVTGIEIGYFVNKMLAGAGDQVAFEIGPVELQRVVPEHHTGWTVAPGEIAFSHSGYLPWGAKSAIATDLAAREFTLLRVNDHALGEAVLTAPVRTVQGRFGAFQELDFSSVERPGTYVLRAGDRTTRPFRIGDDAWTASIWKTLNFFYGNRCGYDVPGSHGVDHLDWFATRGDQRITMSGGWHDAGDLSQGVINTGEATYAMLALAERLRADGGDPSTGSGQAPALVARLLEEARWGLDWVLRVRFPGGYRMGFTNHNLWTNNIVGDADDRTREALNNPNANYIAAAAEALAARVLRDVDPALAARALRTAEEDWRHALVGVESPATRHTPAFAATRVELAGIGITASLELWRATGRREFADTAVSLARVVLASQQRGRVGSRVGLDGFFYTGPDRDTLFHQFHRGNDQAPVVALAQLVEALPEHAEWMSWYAAVARHAEFQTRGAATTAPWRVLPAYVYRLADDRLEVPDSGALHGATREAYRAQVRAGLDMGDGWYLRAFPVWFARRGNYGILLSQAKALATAARLRGDRAALDLAQRQAQWVVGRNPFAQSTMYGEGYDWSQQYSVSSGDFVGSLPVGMQSRGDTDLPYWPAQNMFVWKEVWVHSNARWLWLMEDLLAARASAAASDAIATRATRSGEVVTIRATLPAGPTRSLTLRADNLRIERPTRVVDAGRAGATVEWQARVVDPRLDWVAVIVPDGDVRRRVEVGAGVGPE
ncbi:MAG TPA: glycoside hydrolase family 9 protein [Gemmatimonadaceae bacterium]|nr:glycoside hydrolase family 9 protein [Gemmatimonadaceae bacterium]